MDPEVPRSSRGGGTINPALAYDDLALSALVLGVDCHGLAQCAAQAVKDHDLVCTCHHCIPPLTLGESDGACAFGQRYRVGQGNLVCLREAGDKNRDEGYQASNHDHGQHEYQIAQPFQAGRQFLNFLGLGRLIHAKHSSCDSPDRPGPGAPP